MINTRGPKFYENPDDFDPERFAQDDRNSEISYQPFGKGGKVCIGRPCVFTINFTVKTKVEIGKGGIKYSK